MLVVGSVVVYRYLGNRWDVYGLVLGFSCSYMAGLGYWEVERSTQVGRVVSLFFSFFRRICARARVRFRFRL